MGVSAATITVSLKKLENGGYNKYVFSGNPEHEYLLKDLGKYTMGKACIYVKRLSDINLEALERLIRATSEFYKNIILG